MPVSEMEPLILPGVEAHHEAQTNLRLIRDLMERSTKYSTFSGLSGVLAGTFAILGCLAQWKFVGPLGLTEQKRVFLIIWAIVIVLAIGTDFLLTKRRAPLVGKTILSRLGKQMVLASLPGLGFGALLTLTLLQHGLLDLIYPFWMLAYGSAVCAVGLFSQREVSRLGWAFVISGFAAFLFDFLVTDTQTRLTAGLVMTAITFGGFHIAYGLVMASRLGWNGERNGN
ncbi:MAG: hypothetical protein ABJA67_17765 [Chthonomonadales bacterium]